MSGTALRLALPCFVVFAVRKTGGFLAIVLGLAFEGSIRQKTRCGNHREFAE